MSVHVITASAGSGKTYRLTEVLSQRLSQPATPGESPLRASEVIATTFTVRAAADLVEKTQKRLLDDGNIAAAEEISTALIGTINSMSGRLVTDYAIDAGFSPELRVLDETEQEIVFAAAVDEVVAEAEATHRDLLLRTGHNGGPEDKAPGATVRSFGHDWSRQSQRLHGRTTSERMNCGPPPAPRRNCTFRHCRRDVPTNDRPGVIVWPATSRNFAPRSTAL